jgi:hypothetical protein
MNTYFRKQSNPLLLLGLGGLLFGVFSLMLWLFTQEPTTTMYFGEITAIEGEVLTIASRYDSFETKVASSTKIIREKTLLNQADLAIGQFVQVVQPNEVGPQVADSIRLLKKPPKREAHDE